MSLAPVLVPLTPQTKRCYDCGEVKPIDDFAFQNIAKGTRQGRCRKCHAAYRRVHYMRNREAYIRREVARIARYRAENRPLIRDYLRNHPCVDCGESDIAVLDFDHRDPATKKHNVTILAMHKSWARVATEIEKCDVRCANCHRLRTAIQFNWRSRANPLPTSEVPAAALNSSSLIFERRAESVAAKVCTGCGVLKPITEFGFKVRSLGKRRSRCLACTRAYGRRHYERNRAIYLKKAHRNRTRARGRAHRQIVKYLSTHPCVDCGETNPVLLDFDHRDPDVKLDAVSRLVRRRMWQLVLLEIEKCDVRCANCHRRKTARQFGWLKLGGAA